MVFLKILFIEFIILLPVIIVLKIWTHFATLHTEKKNELRRQKLLSYLPIKTVYHFYILKSIKKEAIFQ